jgi:hypothetical protein
MAQPLMPMATAVWLVEHTTITFRQVARFCGMHPLEIQAIADETIAQNIVGMDPTLSGQLTWDEINASQDDEARDLNLTVDEVPAQARTKGPRYTPVSKRQDKPDAIAWIVRNHPELSDAQISKLIGTTKPTIQAIRTRSHWNIAKIAPNDPVGLGLCSQIELDAIVKKVAAKNPKKATDEDAVKEPAIPNSLAPLRHKETIAEEKKAVVEEVVVEETKPDNDYLNPDDVFKKVPKAE